MDQNEQKPQDTTQATTGDSLESDSNSLEQPSGGVAKPNEQPAKLPDKPKGPLLKRLLARINIYLLLFIVVIGIIVAIFFITFLANKGGKPTTVKTQSLNDSTLKQLANSDITVGQPKQVLNVQSNAVFAGKVLIRDSLEVAGAIQLGGTLNVPSITVAGNGTFDQLQAKGLAISGDVTFQGQLTAQKNLAVSGTATFGGGITAPLVSVNNLQLNGDLNLTHHITAGGPTPTRSNGTALGGGGGASISGSDTAGSINVNTGSGTAAGCFINVTFAQKFNATPHVLVTAVGSAAGSVGVYVNRTTTGFSVCAANTPPSNASFGFDYFVLD